MNSSRLSVVAVALLALAGCGQNPVPQAAAQKDQAGLLAAAFSGDDYKGLEIGSSAPAFHYKTLDGRSVSLKDFAGKALLIDVFSVT